LRQAGTEADFFMLAAASMVLLGVLTLASVMLTRWGTKPAAVVLRPAIVAGELSRGSHAPPGTR
jgi:hypothetical protein